MKKRRILFPGFLLLIIGIGTAVAVMTSASFWIQRVWVGGGGSSGYSASFNNTVSIGQGVAGPELVGTAMNVRGGFIQPFPTAIVNSCLVIGDPAQDTVCTIVGPSGPITVTIPGGTLTQATSLSITLPGAYPVGPSYLSQFTPLNRGVSVSVGSGESPRNPFSILFTYLDSDPTSGLEDTLRLASYDAGVWTPAPGRQDEDLNTLTIPARAFGVFQLMELIAGQDLDGVVVAPNPFRPSLGHRQIVFGNLPRDVKIQVFTLTGELVRDLYSDGGGQGAWDVNNGNGEKVVSGSYLVLLRLGSNKRVITIAIER